MTDDRITKLLVDVSHIKRCWSMIASCSDGIGIVCRNGHGIIGGEHHLLGTFDTTQWVHATITMPLEHHCRMDSLVSRDSEIDIVCLENNGKIGEVLIV